MRDPGGSEQLAMECNQQYALHDGDTGEQQRWIAHVRLTPELLRRLQQRPSAVTIQLQTSASGARPTTRMASTKPSSVLTISDADADKETYEMLLFKEDPKVNAVCVFRPEDRSDEDHDPEGPGYSLYQLGSVFQKLIVQRMLDSTEKDRMKDRHAKSVLESKARASKFVAADEAHGLATRSTVPKALALRGVARKYPPGQDPPGFAKRSGIADDSPPTKKRKLRSALSEAAAQDLQERIARGRGEMMENAIEEETERTAEDSSAPAHSKSSIFSSDSEEDQSSKYSRRALDADAHADSKQSEMKVPPKKAAKKSVQPVPHAGGTHLPTAESHQAQHNNTAEPKLTHRETEEAKNETTIVEATEPELSPNLAMAVAAFPTAKRKPVDLDTMETKASVPAAVSKLPPVKATKTEQKKRARPRVGRLPDISFLPQPVQDICKRLSTHITRTAILDASDYESFTAEHDRLRAEWEDLDKAYSIETILIDGAHFQLPFATTDDEKQTLRETIQASEKKREGLAFVRDSMATIHKILSSLQASISTYEQKTMSS